MDLETLRTLFPEYIELREQGKCPFCKRRCSTTFGYKHR
jgi:hypothetical protein